MQYAFGCIGHFPPLNTWRQGEGGKDGLIVLIEDVVLHCKAQQVMYIRFAEITKKKYFNLFNSIPST